MKNQNFFKVYTELFKLFTPNEVVLISLCLSFQAQGKVLFKTNSEISKDLNIPIATLNRIIAKLVDDGYLDKDREQIKAFQNRKALVVTEKLLSLLDGNKIVEEIEDSIDLEEEESFIPNDDTPVKSVYDSNNEELEAELNIISKPVDDDISKQIEENEVYDYQADLKVIFKDDDRFDTINTKITNLNDTIDNPIKLRELLTKYNDDEFSLNYDEQSRLFNLLYN